MPHDQFGNALKPGDIVMIPCVIKEIYQGEDYCNAKVETLHGRRPDGLKEVFSAINTGQMEKK